MINDISPDDCLNALHKYPMPKTFPAASATADARFEGGWKNVLCPDCGYGGWVPPKVGDV